MVSEAELVAELQAIGHEGWWGDWLQTGTGGSWRGQDRKVSSVNA